MSASELCRLCANLANDKYALSLFEQEQQNLLRQVQELTGLQLQKAKDLPQHICVRCQAQTMQAHEFRECCIRAQQHFTTEKFEIQIEKLDDANISTKLEILINTDTNDDKEDSVNDECILQGDNEEADYQSNSEVDDTDESIKSYLEEKLFECNQCPKQFRSKHECMRHTTTHTVERPFPCQLCDRHFINTTGLNRHIRRQHSKKLPTMKNKKPMIKTNVLEHKLICEECGKHYKTNSKLALHMMRHRGKKPHLCGLCPKGYYTKTDLNHHMYTHTGELPYPCKYCERRFNSRSHLLRHTRTHTNERPFVCEFCGKGFTSSNVHKSHLLTHTGVRDFDCKLCNVSFKRKTNLVAHNRSKAHKRNEENQMEC